MNQTVIILSAVFGLLFVVLVVVLLKKEKYSQPSTVQSPMFANQKRPLYTDGSIRGSFSIP